MSVLVFRSFHGFSLRDGGGGETSVTDDSWGLGDLVQTVAGAGGRLLFTGTAWPAEVWPFDDRT